MFMAALNQYLYSVSCFFVAGGIIDFSGCFHRFWLYETCRGIDHEPVLARKTVKSIGCSKNFRGKDQLATKAIVKQWLMNFAGEITERLEKDKENVSIL